MSYYSQINIIRVSELKNKFWTDIIKAKPNSFIFKRNNFSMVHTNRIKDGKNIKKHKTCHGEPPSNLFKLFIYFLVFCNNNNNKNRQFQLQCSTIVWECKWISKQISVNITNEKDFILIEIKFDLEFGLIQAYTSDTYKKREK